MLNKQALVALAACIPILPTVFADISKTPPLSFCKESRRGAVGADNCPAQITTYGDGFPSYKVYDTETVLEVGKLKGADGGYAQSIHGTLQCEILTPVWRNDRVLGCSQS